jgi:hypothetical protein
MAQDALAHAQHHRAVPSDQCFKGGFISAGKEALQPLPIGQASAFTQERRSAKVPNHNAQLTGRHCARSVSW